MLALTPVAALMFRFNNPDALLVLLLTGAAYATVRAIEAGETRWLVLASALVGLGFITKMLQAFVVVPVFALVYLMAGADQARPPAGPACRGRCGPGRVSRLVGGGGHGHPRRRPARTSAARRTTACWNLIFGYNGFGRLTGNESGSVGGGGGGRAAVGGHRTGSACSAPRWAARSPGCCPPP